MLLIILVAILLVLFFFFLKYPYLFRAFAIGLRTRRLYPTPDERGFFDQNVIEPDLSRVKETPDTKPGPALAVEDREYLERLETIAFLVDIDGKLVHESYLPGFNRAYPIGSFSVAKSVLGTLTGIALGKGTMQMTDSLARFLPELANSALDGITIGDTLAMSTGLTWSESEGNPFSDNARAYYGKDILQCLKGMKVAQQPGIDFNYISGNSLLLGVALRNATGMSLSAYAAQELWEPMGCEYPAFWLTDKAGGIEKAFCCYYASAVDFLKLGRLYLNKGVVNGKRILDPDFIRKATTPTDTYDRVLGEANRRYGLHWWLFRWNGLDSFYARGIYGQYIICLPEYNAVIVRLGYHRKPVDNSGHPPDLFRYPAIAERILSQL